MSPGGRRKRQPWLGAVLVTIAICALTLRAAYTLRGSIEKAAPASTASSAP